MQQSWVGTLVSAQVAGPQLSNSVTQTSVLPTSARITLPPGLFTYAGQMMRITFAGSVSNVVTTPGTINFAVMLGATGASNVWNSGALQMSTTAHTSLPIWGEINVVCRAIGNGTSANLYGLGTFTSQVLSNTAVADSVASSLPTLIGQNVAPVVPVAGSVGFDSTIANVLDFMVTFSVATNPTNFTLQFYAAEMLN